MNLGIISTQNALAIDQKFDDGLASRGNVVAINNNFSAPSGTTCTTGTFNQAAGSSNYRMTVTSDSACVMQFWIGK